ncbi:carboxylesterase/lipase family protein [Paenibacillus fonticola]|uniref:carboxylesterase/lipase family protein n=1 Tax=Paenibacillus fonticola TaxID=379896 RepID=UPI00036E96D5|nr:carboxylesterase/lipase family protein [Paenibacillus fonticola]
MVNLIAECAYGKLKGEQNGAVICWKGIPYAKAPLRDLRYAPPQEPEPWQGVRDATEYGFASLQPIKGKVMDEDCLSLNIWSPGADHRRRPVLVWIHGGGFMVGAGSDPMFDGKSFAEKGDLVVVTINYRLGAMGFLYLDEWGGTAFQDSGNLGILDQIAALKWVQQNISPFGGDPNQVTIFGESAGGRSVGLHLALPQSKGLFHRAIIQSGMISTYRSKSDASRITNEILKKLQISADHLYTLRTIPAEQILEAVPPLRPAVGLEPTFEGNFFAKMPLAAAADGFNKDIPVIIGTTQHEVTPNMDPEWAGKSDEELLALFKQRVGDVLQQAVSFYSTKYDQDPSLLHQLARLLTFHDFNIPAIKLAEHRNLHQAPTWVYRFDWTSEAAGGFAFHGIEVPFVFNNLDASKAFTGTASESQAVADQIHAAWIAFAKTGSPNGPGLPVWSPYSSEERETMLFNKESKLARDPNSDEREFWEQV